jgi:hypothetical protein
MRYFFVLLAFVILVLGISGCADQQSQVQSTGHAVNLDSPNQDYRAGPHW